MMLCMLTLHTQPSADLSLLRGCTMAKIMQQRCLTSHVVHPFHALDIRVKSMQATQPVDQAAACNGCPLASAYIQSNIHSDSPLPTFDLAPWISPAEERSPQLVQQLCQGVANCLRETGCLIVRDPRVKVEDNLAFLDMMERYFAQSTADKLKDTRPELHFQVRQYIFVAFGHKCGKRPCGLDELDGC